jgi:hypothetical protein
LSDEEEGGGRPIGQWVAIAVVLFVVVPVGLLLCAGMGTVAGTAYLGYALDQTFQQIEHDMANPPP